MYKDLSFLQKFKKWSWFLLIALAVFQIIYWHNFSNTFSIFNILLTWGLTTEILLSKKIFYYYNFSSFVIFGYTFTQFYMPLLATTLEMKPVVYNLKYPYELFLHSQLVVITLLIIHSLYRFFNPQNSKNKVKDVLIKNSFFTAPSETQLWVIGFIGLAGLLVTSYTKVGAAVDNTSLTTESNPLINFINGFSIFAYAPYYILFSGTLFREKLADKKNDALNKIKWIVLYSVFIFIISILRNSRGAFMFGLAGVGFTYIFGLLLGVLPMPKLNFRIGAIAVITVYLMVGPLQDLATAMLITRSIRYQISSESLLTSTLDAFNDKEALKAYRKDMLADSDVFTDSWNESYLDNLFLARFCNLKLADLSLEQAARIGNQNKQFYQYSIDKIFVTLPQPVIDYLGIDVDKIYTISTSFGDILYFMAGGGASTLGNFKTGHFIGSGLVAFGWWYLLILAVAMLPVFYLLDAFCNNYLEKINGKQGWLFNFSFCGLLGLISFFTFIVQESVVSFYMYLIRGWIQPVFLYYFMYLISNYIANNFFKQRRAF